MNDVSQLTQLFRYDRWANRMVADALGSHPANKMESSLRLFAHIRAAQQVWFARVTRSDTAEITLWPKDSTLSSDAEILQNVHNNWIKLLEENSGNLDRLIFYKNSSGKSFETALAGILHHVIIHGQHHRAQIASQLRPAGTTPPGTDFLFYLREIKNK